MTRPRAIFSCVMALLAVLLSDRGGAQPYTPTIQNSQGPCTVNMAEVSGHVQVTQNCVDPAVLSLFLAKIDAQREAYREKELEIEAVLRKYKQLEDRLGREAATDALREEVRRNFSVGRLDAAINVHGDVLKRSEDGVDVAAADNFDHAEMLVLDGREREAQPYYERAFRYRPEKRQYLESYARGLCNSNKKIKAVSVYQLSIEELKSLAEVNPAKYLPDLACALVNLAGIYFDDRNFERALELSEEAVAVAVRIKPSDGAVALEHRANSTASRGVYKLKLGRVQEARADLEEAERVLSSIAQPNPNRPSVYQGLATIALREGRYDDWVSMLARAADAGRALAFESVVTRRRVAGESARELFGARLQRGDRAGAQALRDDMTTLSLSFSAQSRASMLFFEGVGLEMEARLALEAGLTKPAGQATRSALQRFSDMGAALRPKETGLFALAHDAAGWVSLRQGEFHSGLASFEAARNVDRHVNGFSFAATRSSRYAALFTVESFSTAAELLLGDDEALLEDKGLWRALARRRHVLAAETVTVDQDKGSPLVDAISGLTEPAQLSALRVADADLMDPLRRCRTTYFLYASLMASGLTSEAHSLAQPCSVRSTGAVYTWILAAEWDRSPNGGSGEGERLGIPSGLR